MKGILGLSFFVILLFLILNSSVDAQVISPTPTSIPMGNGDADNDGRVDINDARTILTNYALNLGTPTDQYREGKINSLDFSVVIKRLLSLTPTSTSIPRPTSTPGGPTPTTPPGLPPGSWTQTFSDEFNGTSLDRTKWATKYAYNSGHGDRSNNDENEWYVDNAPTLSGGILSLNAKRECRTSGSDIYTPYNCTTYPYTSGLIASYPSFSQRYGYFEARMRFPAGRGFWPAFWLLPMPSVTPTQPPLPTPLWSEAYQFWPPEVDIMENIGSQITSIYFNNHYSGTYPTPGNYLNNWSYGGSNAGSYTGPDFSNGFHTFGVDWEPTGMVFYVDGVARYTNPDTTHLPPGSLNPGGMYVIANLAVGGSWPGAPDTSTVFPNQLQIDYIRVYQKS